MKIEDLSSLSERHFNKQTLARKDITSNIH